MVLPLALLLASVPMDVDLVGKASKTAELLACERTGNKLKCVDLNTLLEIHDEDVARKAAKREADAREKEYSL